jgi:hypothetical protein
MHFFFLLLYMSKTVGDGSQQNNTRRKKKRVHHCFTLLALGPFGPLGKKQKKIDGVTECLLSSLLWTLCVSDCLHFCCTNREHVVQGKTALDWEPFAMSLLVNPSVSSISLFSLSCNPSLSRSNGNLSLKRFIVLECSIFNWRDHRLSLYGD